MGFDVSLVLSDDKHYSPFLCSVCQSLVSLDAVVTTRCSHPFCLPCLEQWTTSCSEEDKPCTCPSCSADISADPTVDEGMELQRATVAARPLQQAQPLAYKILTQVQVACIHRTDEKCDWFGDYGHYEKHYTAAHDENSTLPTLTENGSCSNTYPAMMTPQQDRPRITRLKSNSLPSMRDLQMPLRTVNPPKGRSASLNAIQQQQQQDGLMEAPKTPVIGDDPISMENITTPVSPRWNAAATNETIYTSPITQKTKDTPPNKVQRQKSELVHSNNNNKTASITSTTTFDSKTSRKPSLSDDLDASYSQSMDWNTSINSIGNWNNSFSDTPLPLMDTVEEASIEKSLESEATSDLSPLDRTKLIMDRAEKLKKQANAKFNKGEFGPARALYTEGIDVMAAIEIRSNEEKAMLSNMHSNRAVTYFREKDFERCVHDCDKAMEYDPTYEKSWVRKWRALMALGKFDEACQCLEEASIKVPDSMRVQEELKKSREQKELVSRARVLVESGNYSEAKELLKPHSRNSDNIGLLFVAARADAGLGNTESALEKVNKALRFNPLHPEGLEIRGNCLFLAGETEKGAHLLYEAFDKDKENKKIKTELNRAQNIHTALTKARSAMKRGKYDEAVDHFSTAIAAGGDLPSKTKLYCTLRTERAEAYLLRQKYLEALKDCQAVLSARRDHAPAWVVRSEVLIALGKADDAKSELSKIRKTWGADNPTIEEGYRKVDFELRVLQADADLMDFLGQLESGNCDQIRQIAEERRAGERKHTVNRSMSSRRLSAVDSLSLSSHHGIKGSKRQSGSSLSDDRSSRSTYGRNGTDNSTTGDRRNAALKSKRRMSLNSTHSVVHGHSRRGRPSPVRSHSVVRTPASSEDKNTQQIERRKVASTDGISPKRYLDSPASPDDCAASIRSTDDSRRRRERSDRSRQGLGSSNHASTYHSYSPSDLGSPQPRTGEAEHGGAGVSGRGRRSTKEQKRPSTGRGRSPHNGEGRQGSRRSFRSKRI